MNNKDIFYFTGRCLTLDENPLFREEVIQSINNNSIDWEHFTELCSNNFILPLLYIKFKKHNLLDHLPEELTDHLSVINELNTVRNKNITQQITEITKVLNSHNISPVFLKGAGNLIDRLYEYNSERILGDIDFLVSEKDYLNTAQILIKAGYTTVESIQDYKNIETAKHYPRMFHPDFEAVIEIHRIPVNKNYIPWFSPDMIYAEKKEVDNMPGAYVPSMKHRIVHNFIHSQLRTNQGYLYGIVSLRDLYDLYLFSKQTSVEESISHIKPGRKAIAYFVLADKVLGLETSLTSKKNISSWLLLKKHSANLNSYLFYKSYRSLVFITQRIIEGYLGQTIKAIYSREARTSLLKRITNKNWYTEHFRFYKRFFKQGN